MQLIIHGTPQYTPHHIKVNATESGDNTVVAAVAGFKIVVLNYTLVSDGAVDVTWKSGATAISGPMQLTGSSGASPADPAYGVLATASGQPLILNLSDDVDVNGHLAYALVPG